MGVVSGALPQLTVRFGLTESQQESVVGVLYLGGGVGAATGGPLCDVWGRRTTILLTDLVFVVGAVVLAASPSVAWLRTGRIVVGWAVAVSGVADVAYLHEIAPPAYRGSLVSVNEACISLGFLVAFGMGNLLQRYPQNGWRTMFGLSGILAIVQFLGIYTLPESPTWLQKRQQQQQQQQQLELEQQQQQSREDEKRHSETNVGLTTSSVGTTMDPNSGASSSSSSSWTKGLVADWFCIGQQDDNYYHHRRRGRRRRHRPQQQQQQPQWVAWWVRYRPQICIALFLAVAQQFSGQAVVLNYAPVIFASIQNDNDDNNNMGCTLWIGLVKCVVTILVVWKIERIGRRLLLLSGMTLIATGQFMVAYAFGNMDLTQEEPNDYYTSSSSSSWALGGVLLVVTGYSASFGPLTWLLTSELFGTEVRGRALGVSTVVTYLAASLVTSTFLSARQYTGPAIVFALYGLVTVAGLVFAILAIPDTAQRTHYEIDRDLLPQMWCWKRHHYQQAPPSSHGALLLANPTNDKQPQPQQPQHDVLHDDHDHDDGRNEEGESYSDLLAT